MSWLVDAFEQNPYLSVSDTLLQQFRQRNLDKFMQRGFPSRREEQWKYTDISFLEKNAFQWVSRHDGCHFRKMEEEAIRLVFINGHFVAPLSSIATLPQGTILCHLQQALETHASLINAYLFRDLDAKKHPLACLNAALLSDGLFLYVPSNTIVDKPIHVLSLAAEKDNFMMHPRHVVVVESDSNLTFVEEYATEGANHYLNNITIDFFVGRNARLNYYKIQQEEKNATHFANIFFHQQQNSEVRTCSFAVGGQLARDNISVMLQEHHAVCDIKGFYGLGHHGQLMDQHIDIEHVAPHTASKMDYRGMLAKQSRAVFNGKVFVHPQAKKTQAQQFNNNLVLSPLAEVNTKPELEIYADDVQCRHGATIGQLDEEAIFYLCARGIDRQTAKTMLLRAFAEKILKEVTLPWVAQCMREVLDEKIQA